MTTIMKSAVLLNHMYDNKYKKKNQHFKQFKNKKFSSFFKRNVMYVMYITHIKYINKMLYKNFAYITYIKCESS